MSADDVESVASGAASGADELAPGTNVGGYVIDAVIGTGGMGVVYGAHQPRIGKRVAIKVLSPAYCGDPATVARFEQEARLVNEIGHPAIVDALQFGELADGRSFYVMEFLEGESLGTRLDRGPLTVRETVETLDVVCDALAAAHDKGVIHRDLKADNIFLVSARGKRGVKLLDFGLAKLAGRGDPASINKTKSGILVGTPAYMSPEQARGKEIDPRTDIYALGCLAYKMLTGKLPFVADNAMDLIVQQLHRPPPSPDKLAPDTPPRLAKLVVRMMAKSPDERPTLAEIRSTFEELRASVPAIAPPRRSPVWLLAGVALTLVAVIALGAVMLMNRDSKSTPAPTAAPPPAPTTVATTDKPAPAVPVADPGIELDPRPSPAPAAAPTPAQQPHPTPRTPAAGSGSGPITHPADDVPEVAEPSVPATRPGAILVELDQPSKITIDGKLVAEDSKGGRYEVPPGHHQLEARTPGHSAVTRTLDLDPGGTAVVSISFAGGPDDPK